MTWIKRLTVLAFCLILIVPLVTFNTEPDVVSEIDNRKLAENPFTHELEGDLSINLESYVNDRIGLRDEMILAYTVLNDRLFGKMVHPSYSYGEDGYIFGAGLSSPEYGEYHEVFADMVKQLQDYCDARNIPFLMVFNPSKSSVLTEYLPDGMYYNRSWVDQFLAALDAREVRYLDNTVTLREKHEAGEVVFNQKYDANHWNALGAYYGVTKAAEILREQIPTVHVTTPEELRISEKLETTLATSKFPIAEYVPVISIPMEYERRTGEFAEELQLHRNYRGFNYFVNTTLLSSGAPRALVFQGSYMNSLGYPFFLNAFGEYIYVHDYQNVLNFDYYFNIFQPECVVFEVAEYTLSDKYFSLDGMKAMKLNQPLADVRKQTGLAVPGTVEQENVAVEQGNALTTITWNTQEGYSAAWLLGTQEYDCKAVEGGFQVTLKTQEYLEIRNRLVFSALSSDGSTLYELHVQ